MTDSWHSAENQASEDDPNWRLVRSSSWLPSEQPTPTSVPDSLSSPSWTASPPWAGHNELPLPSAAATSSVGERTIVPVAEKPKRRLARTIPWVITTLALLAATFAGGWALGERQANEDLAAAAQSAADSADAAEAVSGAVEIPVAAETIAPGVTVDESLRPVDPIPTNGFEPAAAAAAVVAPAVVLIDVANFGQGSGIIYDESGLLLTNAHVVGEATEVTVQLASGTRVPGEVVGTDPSTDIAVIKIDADEEFGVAVLAPEGTVEVGQLAVVIGSPFGLEQSVTAGVISAINRVPANAENGATNRVGMIQTDAPINPGNSGGALADREGRVIGMNTSIRTAGSTGNVGVGFAIPSETLALVAGRIVAGEPLESGYLGINGADPLLGDPGALIIAIQPDTAADESDLEIGDLIIGMDGRRIASMSDLAASIRLELPGTTVVFQVTRNDQTLDVEVTLGLFDLVEIEIDN